MKQFSVAQAALKVYVAEDETLMSVLLSPPLKCRDHWSELFRIFARPLPITLGLPATPVFPSPTPPPPPSQITAFFLPEAQNTRTILRTTGVSHLTISRSVHGKNRSVN